MTRKTWITLATAVAVVGLVSLAGLAAAQTSRRGGSGWYGDRTPAQYRLTQEQARRIDEIRVQYEEKLVPLEKELAPARGELEAALSRGDVPPGKLPALRRQVRNLEGQVEDLQAEANAAAAQLLSPQQRAYSGDAFDLFDTGEGWSCPCDRQWRNNRMSGRWHGADRWGSWSRGMSWGPGACW